MVQYLILKDMRKIALCITIGCLIVVGLFFAGMGMFYNEEMCDVDAKTEKVVEPRYRR